MQMPTAVESVGLSEGRVTLQSLRAPRWSLWTIPGLRSSIPRRKAEEWLSWILKITQRTMVRSYGSRWELMYFGSRINYTSIAVDIKTLIGFLLELYIYIYISSSSSRHAAGTDIPDPLSPLLPIVHRL